jgi:hypothetical protein
MIIPDLYLFIFVYLFIHFYLVGAARTLMMKLMCETTKLVDHLIIIIPGFSIGMMIYVLFKYWKKI